MLPLRAQTDTTELIHWNFDLVFANAPLRVQAGVETNLF